MDGLPMISGAFTNWKPAKMRNLLEFLEEHDEHKPDFIQIAARSGRVSETATGADAEPLGDGERGAVEEVKRDHYRT